MASLTGQLVAETYRALLKLIDNDILTASEKQITDGFGGGSNVFIDSQGFLRANKYKVTNGLATQFLKADGSLDSNAYLTSITGAQVITALGYTPVTNQRTLTINGVTYNLTADRSWTVEGTAAVWGNITGTLSNQTDLQNALNAKYNVPTGTISQYIRGDGTLATFPTLPGGLPIGGTSGQILAKIDATDYNTHWIDNFATQTKNEVKLGQTLAKGAAVYVSSANGTNMIVSAASNTSEALSSKTFGLLESGGATNDIVKCVTFGLLAGLDTSTASAGDPVWLGPNGTLIFGLVNKPYAPAHLVYIGVVTRVQQNNGEIFVNVQNGFELKEIHDVYIADPANNHGLFYDIADGLWKNKSIATALGYTPQAQLSGTGFVKASGTTITYDNSTYLTTADAASTYQRLDKMVSNLLPSATEYPNSNAVIAALALKADALNPVFTGYMTISGAEPKLYFTDTDQNPDYFIGADAGFFRIYDQTAGATRFVINSSGVTTIAGDLIVGTIAKSGGTASQFLKADGSIDSSTYVTSASLANYLLITTAASTYQRLDKMVSNLLPSDTEYPNSQAVINALALKADAANPVFTGNMTISGAEPKLYFVDTDQNPDYTVFIDSGFFYIYDQTAGATRFSINSSGNISTGVGKSITAGSFVKDGGTASQYLMADGSVSTGVANPVSGTGTTNYIPKWTSASGLGNSLIYDNGTKVFIGTTTTNSISTGGLTLSNATSSSLVLYNGAVIGFIYGSSVAAGMAVSSDYDLRFETGDGSGSNWPERMRLFRSTGNLSLGNGGSPADSGYKLDVNGSVKFSNILDVSGNITIGNGTLFVSAGSGQSYTARLSVVYSYPYIDTYLDSYAGASYESRLNFRTNSGGGAMSTKMTIYNSGNVLIGTTTDSGYKLDVNGTGRFIGALTSDALYISASDARIRNNDASGRLVIGNSVTNTYGIFYGSTHPTVPNVIFFANNSSPTLTLNSNNTATFASTVTSITQFRVLASGNYRINNNADNLLGYFIRSGAWKGNTENNLALATDGPYGISFFTNGTTTERLHVTSGGNVIIGNGTSDNGARLRVVGGTIDFAGDTRYGVARIYNASVGDMFGMEQVGAAQTGTSGAATRIFTANSNNNFISLGWYTNATSFVDALKIIATGGAATFVSSVTATSFFESSDIRLKKLIESNPIIDGIEKLEAKLYEKNGKIELGYFAQDAELIMPHAVQKATDGFLNLSYREIHTAKIARLEKEVAQLKAQLNLN